MRKIERATKTPRKIESYRDCERECYKDKERATEKENRWNEKSFRRFQSFTPIQISKVVLPRLTQC